MEIQASTTNELTAQIDNLAQAIINRGLRVPAILLLEAHKPLQGVFLNSVLLAAPLWIPLLGYQLYNKSIEILKESEALELLIQKLEQSKFDPIPIASK